MLGAGGERGADQLKREAEAIAEQASSSVPDDVPAATAVREARLQLALAPHGIRLPAIRSLFLGRVSHYVLHHSPVAVLIVR